MHENGRPPQPGAVIRSIGIVRFGLLVVFTLVLSMVAVWMFITPFGTWDAVLARYPAHIVIVLWTAIVGTLWLRLQERTESPNRSPVRTSRRIVLVAAILVSAIPPPTTVDAVNTRPHIVAAALSAAFIGLMLWQHIEPPRHVDRLSDGLESLLVLIGTQAILIVASGTDVSIQSFVLEAFVALIMIASPLVSLGLVRRAYRRNSGKLHTAATLSLVLFEAGYILFVCPVH